MRQFVIHKSADFELISYGNGAAYLLRNLDEGRCVFVQDDDVEPFEQHFDASGTDDAALRGLWSDYECVSKEDNS